MPENAKNSEEIKAIKNREAVKKCMSEKDRMNVILPKGTIDRIHALGFKGNAFAKDLILAKLDELEKMQEKLKLSTK